MQRSMQVVVASALLIAADGVWACTSSGSNSPLITINVDASQGPGTVLSGSGPSTSMSGCDVSQSHQLELSLEHSGLRPVSSVSFRGRTYTTYELGPTSPLFFFPIHVKTSLPGQTGGYEFFAAGDPTPTPVTAVVNGSGDALTYPYVGVVVRHGMQSLPETLLATEVVQHTQFPHSNRHALRVVVNVTAPTCTLSDASPALRDVPASALLQPGDGSTAEAVSMQMSCTAAGVPVRLTLDDALDAGNTGSLLTPTAQTTASAVRVQVLRNGVPVAFGSTWDHGPSRAGMQNIDFTARLQRVAGSFAPGLVQGQAVLTANYD